MGRSWNSLLPELLELILNRLPVPDCLRFPAVCHSWWHVQRDHHHNGVPSACQNAWLLLPETAETKTLRRLFYNISEHCYYEVPLPVVERGKFFLGTSHGWLLFVNLKLVVLLNPFIRTEIRIPIRKYFLAKYIKLSSSPLYPDCIVLLQAVSTPGSYIYCHIRDMEWKALNIEYNFEDQHNFYGRLIICGGKLYIEVEDRRSMLIVVELLSGPVQRCFYMGGLPQPILGTKRFLVEYNDEILVAIATYKLGIQGSTGTMHVAFESLEFDVFKADLTQEIWVRVESLHNLELFLGDGHGNSLCLPKIKTRGPGNRIYYTGMLESRVKVSPLRPLWIEYDYGTHKVVNCKLQNVRIDTLKSDNFMCWVVPSLS